MPCIKIPVEIGTTVYEVVPKCRPKGIPSICPYNGGFGTSRCDNFPCNAYITPLPFSLSLLDKYDKTVFATEKQAQEYLEKHKEF